MTATFWTGSSLSFTNRSKTVTVNTGPSLDSVKANSSLTAGNYNEPVEVKSVSGNTITLYNNWPGSTGTTSATIKPSAAAAASAGVAAQQLITDIQSLVSSASATATANSFVKRDSNGRIKAASPSANDDVVTKGYLGSAATKNITASYGLNNQDGDLLKVRDYGFGSRAFFVNNFPNSMLDATLGGFYYGYSGTHPSATPDSNPFPDKGGAFSAIGFGNNFGGLDFSAQIAVENSSILDIKAWSIGAAASGGSGWKRLYHSGNTNFNVFGGNADNDVIAIGFAASSSLAIFYLPLNGKVPPTSISVTGTFAIRSPSASTKIATGLTPTFSNSASSNKVGFLQVSTSGLTAGQPLELQTEGATTKIVANY